MNTKINSKKDIRESNIDARCDVLVKIIKAIRPIYFEVSIYQRDLIETTIGAAIWYIPKPYSAWTGKISLAAIESFRPSPKSEPKLSEEHVFPRKAAARELLTSTLNFSIFRKLYREQYGKLHYVTPLENKILARFQNVNILKKQKDVYKAAGIKLINISTEELRQIKKRNKSVINYLCKRDNKY